MVINAYMLQLYQPLNFLGTIYREIRQSLIDMENMFNLLNEKNKVEDKGSNIIENENSEIVFDNISFGYHPDRSIIKNLSLYLRKNSIHFDKCLLVIDKKVPNKKITQLIKSLKKEKIYKFLFNRKNNKVIFQNPDEKNLLLNENIVKENNSYLIKGAGVDLDIFSPKPVLLEVPVVVLAARIIWDKGIKEYVDAAQILKKKGIIFLNLRLLKMLIQNILNFILLIQALKKRRMIF